MKKLIYLIIVPVCIFMAVSCGRTAEIKVMSFNIRLDTPSDSLNNWQYRKDVAVQTVLDNDVDIIGTQEVLPNQLDDLCERLTGYDHVGIGRDGDRQGEYCALFYKGDRFEMLSSGNFWLSETPEEHSKGWDAACTRIATWAVLKEKKSGRELFAINTHLDHVGKVARMESVRLLTDRIDQYAGGRPVILTGDFNIKPDSEVIKYVLDNHHVILSDSRQLAKVAVVGDKPSTFHGFGRVSSDRRELIDYIFVGKGVEVEKFEILPDMLNGTYVSDHNPIVATLIVR